jgi:hypothetical protein
MISFFNTMQTWVDKCIRTGSAYINLRQCTSLEITCETIRLVASCRFPQHFEQMEDLHPSAIGRRPGVRQREMWINTAGLLALSLVYFFLGGGGLTYQFEFTWRCTPLRLSVIKFQQNWSKHEVKYCWDTKIWIPGIFGKTVTAVEGTN